MHSPFRMMKSQGVTFNKIQDKTNAMNKLLFIYTLILVTGNALIAQNADAINYISGKVSGIEFNQESKISLFIFNDKTISRSLLPDTVLTTTIDKNGKFFLEYSVDSHFFYLSMMFYCGERQINVTEEFYKNPYLCEKGDSVSLKLRLRKQFEAKNQYQTIASFEGKGAQKLNCQYLLYKYRQPNEANGPYLSYMPKLPNGFSKTTQPIAMKEKIALFHQEYQKAIIGAYKGIVKSEMFDRIERDAIANSKYWFISSLRFPFTSAGNHSRREAVITYLKNPNAIMLTENDDLIHSKFYPDFILKKLELDYMISNNITSGWKQLNPQDYCNWMYDTIKEKYSGMLKERLITIWFTLSANNYFEYQKAQLSEAIKLVSQKENKKILNKLIYQSKGKKAFPFEFVDENDQIHTLADYKDKIIILDFWFTGCRGCTFIPPVMKKIMKHLKKRRDVVYLSVSVDRSKEIWEKGLKSGLYTLPGQIHVKTKESNSKMTDPFILNYNIIGYPKVMVIGKNGILLSANPVDPRNDQGENILSLIE